MSLQLMTGPTEQPISLPEAVAHIKPHSAASNDAILGLVRAASQAAEGHMNRSLLPQAWRKTLDEFPESIRLDKPKIIAITSVKYFDEDGVQQTLLADCYQLDNESEPGWLVPAAGYSWPGTQLRANAVEVIYTAGYEDAAAVPEAIKQWMKIWMRAVYDNPTGKVELSEHVMALLDRYIVPEM